MGDDDEAAQLGHDCISGDAERREVDRQPTGGLAHRRRDANRKALLAESAVTDERALDRRAERQRRAQGG